MTIAEVLGVPFNHVTVICKRMGGGFGGKETQAAQPAALAALAATILKRPARLMFTRDDDMAITGKRHPFKGVYRVGFDDAGVITALDLSLYSNGGFSMDLSMAVLERALMHSDNAYFIENFCVTGRICKTNLPSNTAFRGFGGPQGVVNIENILEEIAQKLGIDAAEIRRRNCYGIDTRNTTPYGQVVVNNTLPRLFDELTRDCDYETVATRSPLQRRLENAAPRHVDDRGEIRHQLHAQGDEPGERAGEHLHRRQRDRLDRRDGDGPGREHARPPARRRRAGRSITQGDRHRDEHGQEQQHLPHRRQQRTDLNGAAAVDACQRLRSRLAPSLRACCKIGSAARSSSAKGKPSDARSAKAVCFRDVCCEAYEQRVSLGERGFYATPGIDFDRDAGRGSPFLYFTNGVACSEVLIDRFTGDMRVERVDLLMDIGESINPGIDAGQIVGGFVQGMGWVTTEELKWSPKGVALVALADDVQDPQHQRPAGGVQRRDDPQSRQRREPATK
jgi:xanthine dehydrogenase large subunit